jgi:glutamate synthase domain-containing protein 1
MCGIVGLFLKDPQLEPELGRFLADMLIKMSDRGPDSAGIALYSSSSKFDMKFTIKFDHIETEEQLKFTFRRELLDKFEFEFRGTHAILHFFKRDYSLVLKILSEFYSSCRTMSTGNSIEIFKEVGSPRDFVKNFCIEEFKGTHGVGHTRMATESAVTMMGAHPFSTGSDQCLVHNGSLSNHNSVRRKLLADGMRFETENDSEVAASYLSQKISSGLSLEQALNHSLNDLDGFFTFLVGTQNGFGVLRDRIACKPAILAETDQYVAFGSEYRAFTNLPNISVAKVWEPEPATVYFWKH